MIESNTRLDANKMGTNTFQGTVKYHCNVDGTYKITDAHGNVTSDLLAAGVDYYEVITKITTTGDAAVTSGYITLHW